MEEVFIAKQIVSEAGALNDQLVANIAKALRLAHAAGVASNVKKKEPEPKVEPKVTHPTDLVDDKPLETVTAEPAPEPKPKAKARKKSSRK